MWCIYVNQEGFLQSSFYLKAFLVASSFSSYTTYILSHMLPSFAYCNVVWSGHPKEEALETLLNFGCKLVLCGCCDHSASAACTELEMTTLNLKPSPYFIWPEDKQFWRGIFVAESSRWHLWNFQHLPMIFLTTTAT